MKKKYMRPGKKYLWILSVSILMLSMSSCKKQLEEKPYSFLSPENFYKNESDAKTAINGVYSVLYSWDLYLQPMWNLTILDDDHVSGVDWFLGTSGAGNPQGYWGVDGPWVGCYSIIARASTVLENATKINEKCQFVYSLYQLILILMFQGLQLKKYTR